MRRHGRFFPLELSFFFLQLDQCCELIRPNFVEADSDAQLQCRPETDRASEQHARLGGLRRVQLVQWAVAATPAIVGSVGAKVGIAEFFAAQSPVNQESQGGLFRPLPACQFGSEDSSKAPSRASMAAFTATAWWMIGTSPA